MVALGLSGGPDLAFTQAPSILCEPVSQVVLLGRAAAFAVQAEGSPPLFYQWQANGTNVPGATNASLGISADACPRAGLFHVTVSNAQGTVQSGEASLTVFAFSKANAQFDEFRIWGPELKNYRVEAVSRLPAADLWQLVSAGAVPVNINTASAALLQRFPGIDLCIAQAIIELRAGPDGVEGTADDRPFRHIGELNTVPGLAPQVMQEMMPYLTVADPPVLILGVPGPTLPPSGPLTGDATNLPARFYRVVLLGDAFEVP